MKRVVFILFCMFTLFVQIHAQDDYHPISKEGKVWNMKRGNNTTFMYAVKGDTIISQQSYKKLLIRDNERYGDEGWHYFAAVRDAERKVCIVYAGYAEEILLYDFNEKHGYYDKHGGADGQRGDTLFVFNDGSPVELIAFNWFVSNGEKRGVQRVGSKYSTTQDEWFMEGIGATASFGDPFAFGLLSVKPKLEDRGGGLVSCWDGSRCWFTHEQCRFIPTYNYSDSYNDTYTPMLRDGRVWNYLMADSRRVSYRVAGDSLATNGMAYKKLYARGLPEYDDDEWHYVALLRESGRQVYSSSSLPDEQLVFDFDKFVAGDSELIEGIGNNSGILPAVGLDLAEERLFAFVSCYDGDICIFDAMKEMSGIKSTRGVTASTLQVFDLHGRRLTSKPEKGVYIEGGRKRVAGK